MIENHPIRLTDIDKTEAHEAILKSREDRLLVQGPILDEKNEQFLELFEKSQNAIIDEMKRLGLEPQLDPLPWDKVYICEDKMMNESFNAVAFYLPTSDIIFVSKEALADPEKLLFVLTHELAHRYTQNYWTKLKSGEIIPSRTGYQLSSDWKNRTPEKMFNALNEIFMDIIAITALQNKGIKPKDSWFTYLTEDRGSTDLMRKVLGEIAKDNEWSFSDTWDFFERGAFTDAWPVFRKIEESFGMGSSRILGYLQFTNIPKDLESWQTELNKLAWVYFLIKDTSKRGEIRDIIANHLNNKPTTP